MGKTRKSKIQHTDFPGERYQSITLESRLMEYDYQRKKNIAQAIEGAHSCLLECERLEENVPKGSLEEIEKNAQRILGIRSIKCFLEKLIQALYNERDIQERTLSLVLSDEQGCPMLGKWIKSKNGYTQQKVRMWWE